MKAYRDMSKEELLALKAELDANTVRHRQRICIWICPVESPAQSSWICPWE